MKFQEPLDLTEEQGREVIRVGRNRTVGSLVRSLNFISGFRELKGQDLCTKTHKIESAKSRNSEGI
jgi:hypothetical protein